MLAISVDKQQKATAPPKLYDLTALQRDANRLLGYTAQQTLDFVQGLYEKRLCSYPRTNSRYLSSDMEAGLPALIEVAVGKLPFVGNAADATPTISTSTVINDSKVTDHHAIIHTPALATADLTALPSGERDVLCMIATRLLCAVGEKHVYEASMAVLECGGHRFTVKGKHVVKNGWKGYDDALCVSLKGKGLGGNDDNGNENDNDSEATLPPLTEGQLLPSVIATIKEGKTSPPKRYNDGTLLASMETAGVEDFPEDAERKGLGTPATRAATIEKLIKTGFVERQKKNLVPTKKGVNLIAVLPEDIKSPLLTAGWEQRLKMVEQGELSSDEFMEGIYALTSGLVAAHGAPVAEYVALFASTSTASTPQPKGEKLGCCPRCDGDVVVLPKVSKPNNNSIQGKSPHSGDAKTATKTTPHKPDYSCTTQGCKFALWADNRYFTTKGKKIDKKTATALLAKGRVFFSDLHSEKTGKSYSAAIVMEDDGMRVNFKMDFGSSDTKPPSLAKSVKDSS